MREDGEIPTRRKGERRETEREEKEVNEYRFMRLRVRHECRFSPLFSDSVSFFFFFPFFSD